MNDCAISRKSLVGGQQDELGEGARRSLKRMRRRPQLIATFWKQASLFD